MPRTRVGALGSVTVDPALALAPSGEAIVRNRVERAAGAFFTLRTHEKASICAVPSSSTRRSPSRRASGRAVPHKEPLAREPDERAWTDDRAERYERLRLAAEAMAGLKPQ